MPLTSGRSGPAVVASSGGADPVSSDPFDLHAVVYDGAWGGDPVARAFREEVLDAVSRHSPPGSRILDAGCGTGLDAERLGADGYDVVAIDASAGMVALARERGVDARVLTLEQADQIGLVDTALLDFGVIDCVEARSAARVLARTVRPGGAAVVVPMPRVHPMWVIRCLLRGDLAGAFERLRPVVEVPVAGSSVRTRYLSGRDIAQAFAPWFEVVEQRGLGFLTPPPGSRLGGLMQRVERPLRALPGLRGVGDHLIVVLRRTERAADDIPASTDRGPVRRRLETARAAKTGEIRRLRVLVLHLTDGCNSKCVACDFRGPAGGEALTPEVAAGLAAEARGMGCGEILLTGGEPLLRPDLPQLLAAVRLSGLRVTLLTNGLSLKKHAALVARWCDEVVVSLDGHDAATYRATRGVDGLGAVAAGVATLRSHAPGIVVRARVTVTVHNAGKLAEIARLALSWGLSGISFLAADLQGDAFGRSHAADPSLVADPDALEQELAALRAELPAGFLTDSAFATDRIWKHAAAELGRRPHGSPPCDAPWTSVVVQPDLSLRPCFFIPGRDGSGQPASATAGLAVGLHAMGRQLAAHDVGADPSCQRCVCWARLG